MILWATFGISAATKENSKHASIRQLQAWIEKIKYLRHTVTDQQCFKKNGLVSCRVITVSVLFDTDK